MLKPACVEPNKSDAEDMRQTLLPMLLDCVRNVDVIDHGYVLNLGRPYQALHWATQLCMLERICHPFLRISVSSESNGGPIKVEISGPAGTQDFLQTELGLSRWI